MSKITESARGEKCTLQSPACNHDQETTVFCHLNEYWAGKGKGQKSVINGIDIGFYGCSACHDLYDKRTFLDGYEGEMWAESTHWYVNKACSLTMVRLIEKGVFKYENLNKPNRKRRKGR